MNLVLAAPPAIDWSASFAPLGEGVMTAITSILPVVLPVIGVLIAIRIGVKLFKRYAK